LCVSAHGNRPYGAYVLPRNTRYKDYRAAVNALVRILYSAGVRALPQTRHGRGVYQAHGCIRRSFANPLYADDENHQRKYRGDLAVIIEHTLFSRKAGQNKKRLFLHFCIGLISLASVTLPFDYGIHGIGFAVIFYFFYIERYDWTKFFAGFVLLHVFALTQSLSLGFMQIFTLPSILGLAFLKKYDDKVQLNKKFFTHFTPHICYVLF